MTLQCRLVYMEMLGHTVNSPSGGSLDGGSVEVTGCGRTVSYPISISNVSISMSTDGGYNFDTVLF